MLKVPELIPSTTEQTKNPCTGQVTKGKTRNSCVFLLGLKFILQNESSTISKKQK
jgi:hypothetical protein